LHEIAVDVVRESSSGQDVSSEYVDLQSRLRNLEATRDRIQSFLDQANNVDEALEVNRQLADIEAQIEQIKGRMTYLSGRAAFSTINVTITKYVEPEPTETPTPAPLWSLIPGIDNAIGTQLDIVHGLLEALVWLIIVPGPWLVGIVLIAYAGWKYTKRPR